MPKELLPLRCARSGFYLFSGRYADSQQLATLNDYSVLILNKAIYCETPSRAAQGWVTTQGLIAESLVSAYYQPRM